MNVMFWRSVSVGRLIRILMVPVILVIGLLALVPGVAAASQRYAVTANGVALRTGPGTGYALLGRLNTGAAIDIDCQFQGGTNIGGNATWDHL